VCHGRLNSHSSIKEVHCLRNPVRFVQDITEVIVCHPAIRITSNSRAIKGFIVGIHPALLPSKDEQYSAQQQGGSRLKPDLPISKSLYEQDNPTGARCDDSQAGQVLPVVGYKRIDEEILIE